MAPPRHRGGNRFRGTVRNPKAALTYSNRGTVGFKRNNGRPQGSFRAIAPGAGTVTEAHFKEMDQVLEVEVVSTKVQMLADQGSLVRLSQEMPQDVLL